MPKFLLKRWHGYPQIALCVISVLLVIIIMSYQWVLGAVSFVVLGAIFYLMMRAENSFQEDLGNYISTLSHRIKRSEKKH